MTSFYSQLQLLSAVTTAIRNIKQAHKGFTLLLLSSSHTLTVLVPPHSLLSMTCLLLNSQGAVREQNIRYATRHDLCRRYEKGRISLNWVHLQYIPLRVTEEYSVYMQQTAVSLRIMFFVSEVVLCQQSSRSTASVSATRLDRLLRGRCIFKARSISWIQALEWISTDSYYNGKAKKGIFSDFNDAKLRVQKTRQVKICRF